MNQQLKKVAIITGGAQGIGLAIAKKLGQQDTVVYLWDLNEEICNQAVKALKDEGIQSFSRVVDISNEAAVEKAFEEVINQSGQVHMVVNAAGIVGPNGINTGEVTLAEFEKTCKVNLFGSFIITKHAVNAMMPHHYGRILLIASIAGKEGNAGMCAYSASKAGVIGLVKSVGKEYAESGITVNAIAPATIMTPMVEAMEPSQVKYMTDKIPMKRCGTLEEIASLASWILSPEASFNTGFTFDMTGGRAVY